jgi:hypothetical protein
MPRLGSPRSRSRCSRPGVSCSPRRDERRRRRRGRGVRRPRARAGRAQSRARRGARRERGPVPDRRRARDRQDQTGQRVRSGGRCRRSMGVPGTQCRGQRSPALLAMDPGAPQLSRRLPGGPGPVRHFARLHALSRAARRSASGPHGRGGHGLRGGALSPVRQRRDGASRPVHGPPRRDPPGRPPVG